MRYNTETKVILLDVFEKLLQGMYNPYVDPLPVIKYCIEEQ